MPSLKSCLECGGVVEEWADWTCHPIHQRWHVERDLGEGAFATTVLATHLMTKKPAALKVVFLAAPDMDEEHRAIMRQEPALLKAVADCPYIVNCLDVEETADQMVLVLEYLAGGQLLDHLHELSNDCYTEQQAARLFLQVMLGVAFLHTRSIMHRDIKGENVLYVTRQGVDKSSNMSAPRVKLVDLGMGAVYDPDNPIVGPLGSPGFVAPEVALGEPHTPAMDVFSCGVLLFIMLVGRKPFNFSQCTELQYAMLALKDAPGLKDPRWRALSPAAKDLLMGMLRYNPKHRLTAQQVLQHDWLTSEGGLLCRPLEASVTFGAANVATLRRLKHIVHSVAALKRLAEAAQGGAAASASQQKYGDSIHRLRKQASKSAGFRGEGSIRGRKANRLDRLSIKIAGDSLVRLHDAGAVLAPDGEDLSNRFRPFADRSLHGGSLRGGSFRGRSLRGGSLRGGSFGGGASSHGSAGSSMHAVEGRTDGNEACVANRADGRREGLTAAMKRAASAVALSELVRSSLGTNNNIGNGRELKASAEGSMRGSMRNGSMLQRFSAARHSIIMHDGSMHGAHNGVSLPLPQQAQVTVSSTEIASAAGDQESASAALTNEDGNSGSDHTVSVEWPVDRDVQTPLRRDASLTNDTTRQATTQPEGVAWGAAGIALAPLHKGASLPSTAASKVFRKSTEAELSIAKRIQDTIQSEGLPLAYVCGSTAQAGMQEQQVHWSVNQGEGRVRGGRRSIGG